MKLPELLSPAGSMEALAAAVDAGADAVYFGGTAFNARMFADNFDIGAMREAVATCHLYGARAYVTLNTLPTDREMVEFLRAADMAAQAGADALIVADLGGAAAIRRCLPGMELHASTQASGHNADAGHALAAQGFSRMVCAREMPLCDLKAFVAHAPIEAEVFVHGALCVCHSGQCLFSSLIGGRSGNRGACAQPCRLPYTVGGREAYPLSLRDLCLAEHVPALIEAGVASLKIEGRMKAPEYVHAVTSVWRRLLDERRAASAEEMAYLAEIFSRGGFTDRYFTVSDRRAPASLGSDMLGVRSEQDKQSTRALDKWTGGTAVSRRLPVTLSVRVRRELPIAMSLVDGAGNCAAVTGDIPQPARNPAAALTRESVVERLSKLGGTPFAVTAQGEVEVEPGLILPAAALNALRREAAQQLCELRLARPRRAADAADAPDAADGREDAVCGENGQGVCGRQGSPAMRPYRPCAPHSVGARPMRTARMCTPAQVTARARAYFDIIYLPLHAYDGSVSGVLLPPVIMDSERADIAAQLARAAARGAKHVMLGNAGHLALAREAGMTLHGDFRLNVTNRESAALWQREGFGDVLLSPELTLPQLRDLACGAFGGGIVYGRIPLMILEKCIIREIADCKTCARDAAVLTDRRGVRFPVLREPPHRSIIYNSVPTYMADRAEQLDRAGLHHRHFIFSTESPDAVDRVIDAYEQSLPAPQNVRRIK